jgi:hypothetical protein
MNPSTYELQPPAIPGRFSAGIPGVEDSQAASPHHHILQTSYHAPGEIGDFRAATNFCDCAWASMMPARLSTPARRDEFQTAPLNSYLHESNVAAYCTCSAHGAPYDIDFVGLSSPSTTGSIRIAPIEKVHIQSMISRDLLPPASPAEMPKSISKI